MEAEKSRKYSEVGNQSQKVDSINSCHGILRHPLVLLKAIFDLLATRILNFNHNYVQSSNTGAIHRFAVVTSIRFVASLMRRPSPFRSLNLMRRAQLLQHGGTHGVLVREVSVIPPLTSEPMATNPCITTRCQAWCGLPITAGPISWWSSP